MKNLSLIYNVVLTIAVGVLFYLHFKSKECCTSEANAETKAPKEVNVDLTTLPDTSIAFVNSDTLWSNYKYVLDEKKAMEKDRATKENAFNAKSKAFEEKVNRFREIAERLSQEEGQKQQLDLMQEEQNLNMLREQMMNDLMKKEQEKNDVLQNKILEYIDRLNKQSKNYTYVLGYSKGGGILYAKPSLDITATVLKGLNEEYAAEKKK